MRTDYCRGTLRAPRVMVLIAVRLAAPVVSESTPETMFFSSNKIIKVKNEHFKLQDSLHQQVECKEGVGRY